MWRACPSRWKNAGGGRSHAATPTPEQCDHSPVELPSSRKGRWKKKKGKPPSQGCRGATKKTPTAAPAHGQDTGGDADAASLPANNRASGGLGKLKPAPRYVEAIQPTARGEQTGEGGERPGEGGEQPGEGREQPGEGGEQPREGGGSQYGRGRGSHRDAAIRSSTGEEEDAGEAPGSSRWAEEVDAAVMEAMGFGGFGGSGR